MRKNLRVLVQIYGMAGWHIGRVISARRREIRVTEGPAKNMIVGPDLMTAWRRTP